MLCDRGLSPCLQSQFLLSLQAISIMVHFYMGTKGPENVGLHQYSMLEYSLLLQYYTVYHHTIILCGLILFIGYAELCNLFYSFSYY